MGRDCRVASNEMQRSAWAKSTTLVYYDISDIMVNGDVPVVVFGHVLCLGLAPDREHAAASRSYHPGAFRARR